MRGGLQSDKSSARGARYRGTRDCGSCRGLLNPGVDIDSVMLYPGDSRKRLVMQLLQVLSQFSIDMLSYFFLSWVYILLCLHIYCF